MFDLNREEHLELIGDWQDGNPKPILKEHDGFIVVRDDLLHGGSKIRVADYLIQNNMECDEWVYGGSSANGWAQVSLSILCKKYDKKLVLFMAKRKEENYTTPQKMAISEGAIVNWVEMGYLSNTMSRAVSYVNKKPKYRKLVPFGVDHPTVMASFIRICENIDYNPSEVWVVGGSGTLSRGLQMGWPDAEHNIVSVGHKLQPHESLLAKVYKHSLEFDQIPPENELPPYPSVAHYDAKVWKFVKEYGSEGALIWNVA
tara:strand:- start:258 stop:1031 length:774 start_codon:yes stop_codon:yes gene_type:complete